MNHPTIAFIGAGNMAGSLIGGLIADNYPVERIWATNPLPERLESLQQTFGVKTTPNNKEAVAQADVIVFAVKPGELKNVASELSESLLQKNPLVISIVTGITCQTISKWAQCPDLRVVRTMPNTPALLRSGITGLYANHFVDEEQRTIAESILRAVGITVWLSNEDDLNIVTALSGSGPAYFFLFMEYIKDWAQKMGLTPEQAQLLTVNTALGAARMALESDKEITELRRQVTSPGGTTEQAIKTFEQGKLSDLIDQALNAAHDKAVELAKSIG
jgi:pyrroline-5-carboxylate reductase